MMSYDCCRSQLEYNTDTNKFKFSVVFEVTEVTCCVRILSACAVINICRVKVRGTLIGSGSGVVGSVHISGCIGFISASGIRI